MSTAATTLASELLEAHGVPVVYGAGRAWREGNRSRGEFNLTAVTESTPFWLMLLMVVLVIGSALVWYTLVTLFMSSAPIIRRFQHLQHWIERAAGVCFVAIGGRILSDARNPVAP